MENIDAERETTTGDNEEPTHTLSRFGSFRLKRKNSLLKRQSSFNKWRNSLRKQKSEPALNTYQPSADENNNDNSCSSENINKNNNNKNNNKKRNSHKIKIADVYKKLALHKNITFNDFEELCRSREQFFHCCHGLLSRV